jgi:hypothetical protein
MRAIGETLLLRYERSGHRPAARAAGEHDLTAGRLGNGGGIEAGQRNQNGLWKALDRGLVRLAHIDEQEAAVAEALSNLLRRQITHLRILFSHCSHFALVSIQTYVLSP